MAIGFQCRCGALRGEIEPRHAYLRLNCYCRDCQAFARALDRERETLDEHGGSDIIAMLPAAMRFTTGTEHLACLSLSPNGLLRWHSSCCNTAIANTPRKPDLPYVGVLARCIDGSPDARDSAFGPARIALGTDSALDKVSSTPVRTTLGVAAIMVRVAWAKLTRRDRINPFFDMASSQPVAQPRILTKEARLAATAATPRN